MSKFGKKVGSLKNLKRSMEKKSSGHMIYIPKPGEELLVRFLQENDEWWEYAEVWDNNLRTSYPLPDDPDAPGYVDKSTDENRIARRYMANAVVTNDDGSGRAGILKMPKSLVDQLVGRIEKHGTIKDRDYIIYRTGEGVDTRYHADPEAPGPSRHTVPAEDFFDIGEALQDAYDYVWGEAEVAPPVVGTETVKRPKRREAPVPGRKIPPPPDEKPFTADDIDDSSGEEDDYYDEDELKAMKIVALRVLADEYGVAHTGLTKSQLVAELLAIY